MTVAPSTVVPVIPLLVAAPLALAGGLLLDTAFPGIGAWPLALLAPVLLLLGTRGRSGRTGYGLGVLFGLGFMVPHLQWSGTFVGALPWLSLATLEALILGLVGLLWPACWRLAARRGLAWSLPLTTAAVWLAVEALRARAPFGGFPWGRLAFSQSESPLVWLAPLGGAPGVGFAVIAVAGCLAMTVVALLRSGRRRSIQALIPIIVVGLLLPLLIAAGQLAGRTARPGDATITLAAIQGNVPQAGLDFNAQRRAVLDNHAEVTRGLADRIATGEAPEVDLVMWPENASDIDPLRNADAAGVISAAADAIDAPVLVGAVLREPGDNLTNAILLWQPGTGYQGDDSGRYAKQKPAPFAEYIPYRSFFRAITPLVDEVPRNFVPGPGPRLLSAGSAAVGPVICFEVADDGVVGGQVRLGADLLAVPTNNATFGLSDESTQQLAMTRFRAVEHGRTAVQVSTVGVSAIVYPDGSQSRTTALFTADALVADVPLRSGLTPATRLGPWPELVTATAVAMAALLLLARQVAARVSQSRRADRPDPQ